MLYDFIDPSLQEQARVAAQEQLFKQGNLSEEQIDTSIEMMSKFQKPWIMAVTGVFGNTFIGLIIALITAIFTKKNPPEDIVE